MQNKIKPLLPLFIALSGWLIIYWQALNDMTHVWLNSETYKHCFFVLPIIIFLIYEKRALLKTIEIKPAYWVIFPLILGQTAFLLADLVDIKLFAQLAAYGSLICLLWLLYGTQMIKALMFPLFYLVLAIPMGEEFVPQLQNITADISVYLVELTGIPVYREGLYIYVSNGTFEVAEACAGIRFLIATIAMGFLYAYLFYRSFWRRAVFILLCIVVPIVANGIRAYGIIAIGHYSDMEHAVGADHLVYGWFFFAFILILVMFIGNFWREDLTKESDIQVTQDMSSSQSPRYLSVLAILMILMIKPVYQYSVASEEKSYPQTSELILQVKSQFLPLPQVSWQPTFGMASQTYSGIKAESGGEIFIGFYAVDKENSELISWSNQLYSIEQWSKVSEKSLKLISKGQDINARLLTLINAAGKQKKVLYWYQVNESYSAEKIAIKLAQLLDKLAGNSGAGHIIAISIPNSVNETTSYESFIAQSNLILGKSTDE